MGRRTGLLVEPAAPPYKKAPASVARDLSFGRCVLSSPILSAKQYDGSTDGRAHPGGGGIYKV